jgi:hypothetical protein
LAGINLRYNHADNNVRANYHGSIYLAYLRRCLPISSAQRAHNPKAHKAHASYRLQEHLVKHFPNFLFWRLGSEAAKAADYGRSEVNFLLDHYGGRTKVELIPSLCLQPF